MKWSGTQAIHPDFKVVLVGLVLLTMFAAALAEDTKRPPNVLMI